MPWSAPASKKAGVLPCHNDPVTCKAQVPDAIGTDVEHPPFDGGDLGFIASCTLGVPSGGSQQLFRRGHRQACAHGRVGFQTCYLGSGVSVCAIDHGRSVDTSMGLTPLEGLIMGTRSGDLDPSIVLYLMREKGLSVEEVDDQ